MIPELTGLADPDALPEPTAVSAPFWAAAARGELHIQRCAQGHPVFYPRLLCPACGSTELEWERACGEGEVVTYAPVHRPPWDGLPRPRPYVVALVRLREGPQILSTLEQVEPGEARIGMPVRAAFEHVREDLGMVRFVPAGEA